MLDQARPYQGRIVHQSLDYFTGGIIRSILIESPTGSGKTFMGLHTADELRKHLLETEGEELMVVWVAMRRFLLHQVVDEVTKFGLNDLELRTLSMFDTHGREALDAEIERRGCKVLLVLDEAQHDAATSMTDVYQAVKPDYTLGLSATPFRVDKAKLCFEKQIRDAGIYRLIHDGYLSKFDLWMMDEWTPEKVVNQYLANPDKWGKSVFYWLNTVQATECYERLLRGGAPTHLITGGDSDKQREQYLTDFREGDHQCLVNCMVLTEGFDCPELETCWVRDSSKGPTMQMAGRAFRLFKRDGKFIRKNIVQSVKTRYPATKIARPEEQWLMQDGVWTPITVNERMNDIAIAALKRTIANTQPLPKFITAQGKPQKEGFWGNRG